MGKPFIHITTKTVTQREGNPFLVSYQSDLVSRNYEFKNLVFASGSVEVLFYVWAMRVLEKLGILQKVKHFAGVGTCALEGLFLIFGLSSNELQEAFNEHLLNVLVDDKVKHNA